MPDFFLGRQPIFDRDLSVMGYELLYRSGEQAHAGPLNGDQATSQVILNSMVEIGLPELVGRHHAFINLTRNFLLNPELLPPPDGRMVLEVLEDIDVDAAVVDAVADLSRRGYLLALDDFEYRPELAPLVAQADFIKLDLLNLTEDRLQQQLTALSGFTGRLVAEKIEEREQFERCRELGFDYFQGYFLSRPSNVKGKRLPANRLATMGLLAKLQNPDAGVAELEAVISRDITLSYKLLRYINSAVFFGRRDIASIRHAIVYLGRNAIRSWATLIALAGVDDKPDALVITALMRARMCDRLAAATGMADTDAAFTVGLFSALDALMDAPLEELVRALPLSPEVCDGLLERSGALGELLTVALDYERGDWERLTGYVLSPGELTDIYVGATQWAEQTLQTLG